LIYSVLHLLHPTVIRTLFTLVTRGCLFVHSKLEPICATMFSGETFYLVPENVIRSRIKIFKEQVEQNDGVWNESLDSSVTILLLDDEVDKDLSDELCRKINNLSHTKIVRLSWLVASLKRNAKLDCTPYAVQFPGFRKHGHEGSVRPNTESLEEHSPPHKRPRDEHTDSSENETSSVSSELEEVIHIFIAIVNSVEQFTSGNGAARGERQGSANPNQAIIEQLKVLASGYRSINDRWRTYAYDNAIRALENCDYPITSSEQLRSVRGIGKRIAEKIEDFWKSGNIGKAEEFKRNEHVQALELFNSIWGVGPVTSEQWYAQGFRTLDDIRQKAQLTHQQKIGLKYRDEFLKNIPRKEVAQIAHLVQDELMSIDEGYIFEVCGSYRREEPFSGDIDILITHPDGSSHRKVLPLLVQRLSDKGYFTDNLTEHKGDVHKYMGVCRLPEEGSLHRRIDILAVPFDEFPTSLLYNTGSAQFVRSINGRAKSMGMRLNMHGLRKDVKREGRRVVDRGQRVDVDSEADIFHHLSLKWRDKMAKPPRACFVYKPLHKYRYLPRPDVRPPDFDYEAAGSSPDDFEEKLEKAPKLWVAWLYRKPSQETRNVRQITKELFGDEPRVLDMKVFKNTPYWNRQLWKIKHLIEINPISFPHGEPTEADIPYVRLLPSGECLVNKRVENQSPIAEAVDDGKSLETLINRRLKAKWHRFDEILEDSPWSPPNQSRF
ncbi:hypothetical protein M513_06284, partial [Trichuris suis]